MLLPYLVSWCVYEHSIALLYVVHPHCEMSTNYDLLVEPLRQPWWKFEIPHPFRLKEDDLISFSAHQEQ